MENSYRMKLKESQVLVLYTGGTIGMVRNCEGALVPESNVMEDKIRKMVTLHDEEYSRSRFGEGGASSGFPLVLPVIPGKKRVLYTIHEYNPILDSSNMRMDDWIQVAADIQSNYRLYDGFVILHGTDTLAYTSSALSFMLENLGKTVVITGSQIPAFEARSDGRENLVGSLIIAGNFCIPEVTVYFDHKLMRGNRTIKISTSSLHAFDSPNLAPLATVGIDISVDWGEIWRDGTLDTFTVHDRLCRDVVLLRLFPSITIQIVKQFLKAPILGVVLQCYGAGNVPSNRQDILDALTEATQAGVLIVSCTQCNNGEVSPIYETGRALIDSGVIPGRDITPEAALTKLSYVLSKDSWNLEERRRALSVSLKGEITLQVETINPNTKEFLKNQEHKLDLMAAMAQAMHLSSDREMAGLKEVLLPSLTCSMVYMGDTHKLEELQEYQANLSGGDYSGRTPLHIAAGSGQILLVGWLLERGASLHARDYMGQTPLMVAVKAGYLEVVRLLRRAGAYLGLSDEDVGVRMTVAAGLGRDEVLKCLLEAGAGVNTVCPINGNTGLHSAVEGGHLNTVRLLLEQWADPNIANKYGLTPLNIVHSLNRDDIMDMMELI